MKEGEFLHSQRERDDGQTTRTEPQETRRPEEIPRNRAGAIP